MGKITVQLELIPAIAEDMKSLVSQTNNESKYTIKHGQLYFLQSNITKLFEGPYILNNDTDLESLALYLELNMVFIPVNNFECKIPEIKKSFSYAD